MAVELVVSSSRVARGQAPTAVVVNTGEGNLAYTFPFRLERRTDTGWRWINRREAWPMPLLPLAAGHRSAPQSLALYIGHPTPKPFRPGLYRVTKSFDLSSGVPRPVILSVSATFRVAA
jgi:hypothetical protein